MNSNAPGPIMNLKNPAPFPPRFETLEAERDDRKRKLVGAFRLFGKFGFDEGAAGHITVRDPEFSDRFWVNPLGVSFKQIKVSDLLLVNHQGEVLAGNGLLSTAAFMIHSQVHRARPEVNAVAHAHSLYGKAWASLGRLLDPITQDACAFYQDHVVFDSFGGVVLDSREGERIAEALGDKKAAILLNHGLLTAGITVESATWWFITMERSCQVQMLTEAVGKPGSIDHETCLSTYQVIGTEPAGWFSFLPLYSVISAEQPEMFN
ncbi:MAG: ribulose-5-phosphate 4-epimerase/fuculose-1-phosphate aldolase [Bermanella sp.]|jgi:ribulose-5-phosphate 4-epimerase/fuculose-1-phosphate aldolase